MIKGKKVLGVITARAGSKGLPGKNMIDLCGKPLLEWTIDVAKQSNLIDTLMISTDCPEMAKFCSDRNVLVPFLRPDYLASDQSTSADVIIHSLNYFKEKGEDFDLFVLLEPTSPLREPSDIDDTLNLCSQNHVNSVVSVCEVESTHPDFLFKKNDEQILTTFSGEKFVAKRRQDLVPVYYITGVVYTSKVNEFILNKSFVNEKTAAHVVPKWKAPEVDDILDLNYIEAIIKNRGIIN